MARRRALVVDDDRDTAESFARLVQTLGFKTAFETDPVIALQTAERLRPEIVFLDIGMPGLTGHELGRLFRQKYGWEVRIVAVTAHTQEQDRALSRAAGFDAHLAKPVDLEVIRTTVVTLFPDMRWR
jgi:CheY-like chemotaxis protein